MPKFWRKLVLTLPVVSRWSLLSTIFQEREVLSSVLIPDLAGVFTERNIEYPVSPDAP